VLTSPHRARTPFALLAVAGALLLGGCAAGADPSTSGTASGTATSPAASGTATSTGAVGGESGAPTDDPGAGGGDDGGGGDGGGSAPSVPSMTIADVLGRYPDCAAMGSLLGSALDGLELNNESNDGETIQCDWMSTTGDDVNTVSISVTSNNGAVDVPTKEDLDAIGSEYFPDAALESRGGIAYGTKSDGDLRIYGVLVDVPGVGVAVTSGALNEDPRIFGAPAVAVATRLLGIAG